MVRPPQEEEQHDLEGRIPQRASQGQGALADLDGGSPVAPK
jgi:hypothetical protein